MTIMTVIRLVGRLGAVCGLVFSIFFLAGCKSDSPNSGFSQFSGGGAAPVGAAGAATEPSNEATPIDLIHVGDTLLITFSDLPILEPPVEQRVKDDKTITLMQNQTFEAAG